MDHNAANDNDVHVSSLGESIERARQQIVSHCDAINKKSGTDKISQNAKKHRRQQDLRRARREEDVRVNSEAGQAFEADHHASAIRMQAEIDELGFGR